MHMKCLVCTGSIKMRMLEPPAQAAGPTPSHGAQHRPSAGVGAAGEGYGETGLAGPSGVGQGLGCLFRDEETQAQRVNPFHQNQVASAWQTWVIKTHLCDCSTFLFPWKPGCCQATSPPGDPGPPLLEMAGVTAKAGSPSQLIMKGQVAATL